MSFAKILVGSFLFTILLGVSAFSQRFAVTSGSWTDPIWSDTQGGVAGSAATPTSADNITINNGIVVTVNTAAASCNSVSFQDSTGSFILSTGSILNVYGNFTIDSNGTAFSSWAPGAKLRFTGSNPQMLSGFSIASNLKDSTILMEVIVDKSGDTLRTPGTDMKIGLGTSFDIVRGVFWLGSKDDFNGRIVGASTKPTITVDSGAVFYMVGSTSAIRSGTSGSNTIGKMVVKGDAYFASTSSLGICIGGIDVQSPGELHMESFSSGQPGNIRLDTVHVNRGATLWNSSTISFWNSSVVMYVDTGAIYKVTTSTTNFPATFYNTGTVRYQRTAGDSSQTIVDMNYYRLEVSYGGTKTWTLGADRYVFDSLEINNKARFTVTAASSQTLTINNTLRLTSGNLDNSSPNISLSISDGGIISRATGTISAAPNFESGVNLRYTSTTTSVSTGPEVPLSSSVLQDLSILCDTQTVTLTSPMTVNGTFTLSNGVLNNSSQTLTFANGSSIRRATGTITAVPVWSGIVNVAYISTIGSVTTGYELPSATNVLQNLQIICDTQSVTLSFPVTVNGLLTLSNGTFNNSGATLTLADGASIRRATAVLTAAPNWAGTINLAYISTLSSVTTGYELPSASNVLQTLSIESPKNITLNAPVAVNESLAFSRGVLYLGNNDLTLAAGAVVGGTPADTTMIITNGTGTFKKKFSSAPSSFVFPVGDTSEGVKHYTPASLSFASGTFDPGASVSVRVVRAKDPHNPSPADYLNRYWLVTPSGMSAYSCDVVFQYVDSDINGNEANIGLGLWSGSSWNVLSAAQTATNQLQASGVTSLAEFTGLSATSVAVSYHFGDGWNLISVPVLKSSMVKDSLFPTSTSRAFAYQAGYVDKDTLSIGSGYWLKFTGSSDFSLNGVPALAETINVNAGWNIIGSMANSIHKSKVQALGTSVASSYFQYNGAYAITDTLYAGKGFWVKVSTTGMLVLSENGPAANGKAGISEDEKFLTSSLSFRFDDASGKKQTLYLNQHGGDRSLDAFEMPPLPGFENSVDFDVRYQSNRFVELANGNKVQEFPVSVIASQYPVTITVDHGIPVPGIKTSIKVGKKIIPITNGMKVQISNNSESLSLVVAPNQAELPTAFSLEQNYPNPFNPSTTIGYALPEQSNVTIVVYNLLGQKLETVFQGHQDAGNYSIQWSSKNLPSGLYFYKMEAVGQSGNIFTRVRKMVLSK